MLVFICGASFSALKKKGIIAVPCMDVHKLIPY